MPMASEYENAGKLSSAANIARPYSAKMVRGTATASK